MKCITIPSYSLSVSLFIWLLARLLLLLLLLSGADCFVTVASSGGSRSLTITSSQLGKLGQVARKSLTKLSEDGNNLGIDDAADETASSITMDDGGSDLTDRFKYKVHALMGTFSPPEGKKDDENQMGNILNAMLQFPTEYTFSVVGRNAEDETTGESACDNYAKKVRTVIESTLGETTCIEMRVTPRGKRFTKVSVKALVESAAIIATIYEELGELESTVMKF